MYCEDVDLSLRLRLAGGRLAVVPDARVTHEYAFTKGSYKWRLLERNRWATMIRTYPAALLLAVLPALLAAEAGRLGGRGPRRVGRDEGTGHPGSGAGAAATAARAAGHPATAAVSASAVAATLTAELSSPYFGAVGRHPLVRAGLTLYWRLVSALLR